MKTTGIALLIGAICFLLLFFGNSSETPKIESDESLIRVQAFDRETSNAHLESVVATDSRETIPDATTSPSLGRTSPFVSGVVYDFAGNALAGASCSLWPGRSTIEKDSQIPVLEKGERLSPIATAISNQDGSFRIQAPSGFSRLRVEHRGSPVWEEDSLRAGDFRWVHLSRGIQLSIQIQNEKGAGIEGVELEALRTPYSEPSGVGLRTLTDADGSARLFVAPGLLHLGFRHAEYRMKVESWNVPKELPQWQKKVVLSRGIRIVGRVRLPDNSAPPDGTRVRIEPMAFRLGLCEVPCDRNGSFATNGVVRPGQLVDVAALSPGFGETRIEVSIPKTIPNGDSFEVNLVLPSGEKRARGRLVDTTGRGVGGVPLFLKAFRVVPEEENISIPETIDANNAPNIDKQPTASRNSQWRRVGESKEDGSFWVEGMAAQIPYSLLALPRNSANSQLWIPVAKPGAVHDLGVVALDSGASLWGFVRDDEGRPLPSLEVSVIEVERRTIMSGQSYQTQRPKALRGGWMSVSNAEGRFRIEPLPSGEYFLSIGEEEFGPYQLSRGEERGPVALVSNRNANGSGKRSFPIKGQIYGDPSAPMDRLFANLFRHGTAQDSEFILGRAVGMDGKIDWNTSLPGPYSLQVIDLSGNYEIAKLAIEPGQEEAVELKLQRRSANPLVLEGDIVGFDGTALSGIKISLKFSPDLIPCSCFERVAVTDASGKFSFGPVIEGAHRLLITDPQGQFHSMDFFPAVAGNPILLPLEN